MHDLQLYMSCSDNMIDVDDVKNQTLIDALSLNPDTLSRRNSSNVCTDSDQSAGDRIDRSLWKGLTAWHLANHGRFLNVFSIYFCLVSL